MFAVHPTRIQVCMGSYLSHRKLKCFAKQPEVDMREIVRGLRDAQHQFGEQGPATLDLRIYTWFPLLPCFSVSSVPSSLRTREHVCVHVRSLLMQSYMHLHG